MPFMYLYVLFTDDRFERYTVKRFTDLSQTKSRFYYYEEPSDFPGKGKSILRDEVCCFEVTPFRRADLEEYLQRCKK